MKLKSHKIGVIGAGGWGSAITIPLCSNSHEVRIWSFESDVADEINTNHTNEAYLPGAKIPDGVKAFTNIEDLADCDLLVNAVPTQFIRETFSNFIDVIKGKPIVNLSKGIEKDTLMSISEIFKEILGLPPEKYIVLTGPSHAEEVALNIPTTVTAASLFLNSAKMAQDVFNSTEFRVYSSIDVTGCEMGGALKNVIAIAAGIIDGLGLGDNTKAALITRGLAEITRLGLKLGADPLTFSGLSGLGDLVVTCDSKHSRNRYVGEQIGKGRTLADIKAETKKVAEGVFTTESAYSLGQKYGVEMPIVEQMHKIIFRDVSPKIAIKELMERDSKNEIWK